MPSYNFLSMKYFSASRWIILCLLVTSACDNDSSQVDGGGLDLTSSALLGTWVGVCSSSDGSFSSRAVVEYNADGTFNKVTESHFGPICRDRALNYVRSGRFVEHSRTEIEDRGIQTDFDEEAQAYSIVLFSTMIQSSFNNISVCGISDWQLDVSYDFTSCINGPDGVLIGVEVPYTTYDIALRERDQLFFGNEVSFAAWNRPVELEDRPQVISESGAIGDEFASELVGFWRSSNLQFTYLELGSQGLAVFYDPSADAACLIKTSMWLFQNEGENRYRDAYSRYFFTIVPVQGELQLTFENFSTDAVYSMEPVLSPGDLPICS